MSCSRIMSSPEPPGKHAEYLVLETNRKYLILWAVMHDSRALSYAVPATATDRCAVDVDTDDAYVGCVVKEEVTIELDGRTTTLPYSAGDTLLQTARMAGLRAPSSCEVGSCGTCMARLTDGCVRMINNDALEDDEVEEGWVLTCQALPTSRTVRVVYE